MNNRLQCDGPRRPLVYTYGMTMSVGHLERNAMLATWIIVLPSSKILA
jgi:hypothetical protein